MQASAILEQIITILFGAITQTAESLGEGVMALIDGLFFTGTGDSQQLSVFAILTLVFAGVALSLSLGRLILNWLGGLGAGNL